MNTTHTNQNAPPVRVRLPLVATRPLAPASPPAQTESALLQLPAELRISILRELLLSNEPIGWRQSYLRHATSGRQLIASEGQLEAKLGYQGVEGYLLHPAILSACQILYREGWQILYQENTLSILVEPLHFPACVCDQCGSLWAHTPVIEDNALVQKLDYGQTGYNIDVQKFVLSFRSFQLELGEDVLLKGVRKFADMVDYLAPILHARRVTIKLLISDTIANDPTVRLSLKMLGAFDCASIKFLGPSTPYTRMLGANHPEGRVIPKHILPALDPPLQNMRLVKHQLMHIYRATDKVNWIEKKDTEMIAAYRRQDVPAFEKAREEIVERYQRANQIVEDSAYNHDFLLDNLGCGHWGVARDGSRIGTGQYPEWL